MGANVPSSQGATSMVDLEEKLFDMDLSSNPEVSFFVTT